MQVVLIEPEDPKMEKSIQKQYREKYPELTDLKEDFEVIEQITKIRSQNPDAYTRRKIIKISHDNTDRTL